MGYQKSKRPLVAPAFKGSAAQLTGQNVTDPAGLQLATVALSAAQLIAMGTTPVNILPAPGANKVIAVEQIVFQMKSTATQFTGGGVVTFVYSGGSVATHTGSVPASVVQSATGSMTELGPAVASNGTTLPANTGVDITNATAPFAAGTGTAKVFVKFRVLDVS